MIRIAVYTEDELFKKELSDLVPRGYKVVGPDLRPGGIVFIDIDTMRSGLVKELSGDHLVVAVTRKTLTEPVMEAAAYGAYEIIHRPFRQGIIVNLLTDMEELAEEEKDTVPVESLPPTPTCVIVGESPLIMDVCKKLARLSQVDTPVLITGETGTGKELIAESIAQLSSRFGKPFVVVNCAAVPENLLESELFGFEKGAFTGADSAKEGMLQIADEGCVFFDEIGELPLSLQGKLLRFLQTQTFYPIGSTREAYVDVRVISATNRDLLAMVREGKFREDLYYRLRVSSLHVPSLRERAHDIPSLVHFFIGRYRHSSPGVIKGFTKRFLDRLMSYDWPGNIRQLENVVRSSIALSKTPYLTSHELRELSSQLQVAGPVFSEELSSVLIPVIKAEIGKKERDIYEKLHNDVDKIMLSYVLSATRENQSEAARILGISRLTLRKKLGLLL